MLSIIGETSEKYWIAAETCTGCGLADRWSWSSGARGKFGAYRCESV